MASQVQLIFFLVGVALIHSNAAPLSPVETFDFTEKIVYTGKLDKTINALLPYIRDTILKNGLDPMDLIDISEPLIPFLPKILAGSIDLKKGWLQELSNVKKANDATVTYTEKQLTLDINLKFDLLDFNYEYLLKYMLFQRKGDIYGRFENTNVKVDLTVDLKNYYINVNSIKFDSVKKLDIKFEGHILDYLLNLATKAITTIFKKQVITHMENRALKIFRAKIDEWNKIIPRPDREKFIVKWMRAEMLDL